MLNMSRTRLISIKKLKQLKYAPSTLSGELAQALIRVGGHWVRGLFKQWQIVHGVAVKRGFNVLPAEVARRQPGFNPRDLAFTK